MTRKPKYRNFGNSGELNAHNKLTEAQVKAIRKWYQDDKTVTQKQIADAYNVSDRNISKIISRQTWAYVVDE